MGKQLSAEDLARLREAVGLGAFTPDPDEPRAAKPKRPGSEESGLLTPGDVALLWRVDPKTVTRWAKAGRIPSIRTPGGHRRFRVSDLRAVVESTREAQ